MTWDDSQAERAAALLRQFNGREEVCAVLECADSDLDALCRDAFGMGFDEASAHFAAQGRAALRDAQISAALDGDRSMLLALGKQYLGQNFDSKDRGASDDAGHGDGATVLSLVRDRYADAKDRKPGA